MIKYLSSKLVSIFTISFGLFLAGSFPALFDGISLNFPSYFSSLIGILNKLFTGANFIYVNNTFERPMFPTIFEPWFYSISILLCSFTAACIISISLTFLTLLMPERFLSKIRFMLFTLESIPDLLIIAVFQIVIISIFKATGIVFFDIASYSGNKPFILPLIALTILPSFFMYRHMLLEFENEEKKQYVELAKGKGLSKFHIQLHHIFRNALVGIFLNAKYILLFMLSNLLIVEKAFNTYGLLNFMLTNKSSEVFTIGILLLFIPIYLLITACTLLIKQINPTIKEISL